MSTDGSHGAEAPRVAELLGALADRGWTVAAAESLTAGLVAAAIADVPGASAHLRGGVVAYATDVKAELLGVPADLLAHRGPVDAQVALAMADGVRRSLRADVGLATTGVAGPGPADGLPAGTVHVAVVTPQMRETRSLTLGGGRADVRRAAVVAVIDLAVRCTQAGTGGGRPTLEGA